MAEDMRQKMRKAIIDANSFTGEYLPSSSLSSSSGSEESFNADAEAPILVQEFGEKEILFLVEKLFNNSIRTMQSLCEIIELSNKGKLDLISSLGINLGQLLLLRRTVERIQLEKAKQHQASVSQKKVDDFIAQAENMRKIVARSPDGDLLNRYFATLMVKMKKDEFQTWLRKREAGIKLFEENYGNKLKEVIKNLPSTIHYISNGIVGRDIEVRLLILGVLCQEHVCLLGPPGVAKSLLCRRLSNWISFEDYGFSAGEDSSRRYFEYLLTGYTTMDELFGPISLKQLEDDRLLRVTNGFLPSAVIAFLDETFNCNSVVLNSLLPLMNERVFHNGNEKMSIPIISIIGASNKYPSGEAEEFQALYDRFMLRKWVYDIESKDELLKMLISNPEKMNPTSKITIPILQELRKRVLESDDYVEPFHKTHAVFELIVILKRKLREQYDKKTFLASSRRWRKIYQILRIVAYIRHCLEGESTPKAKVSLVDSLMLQYMLPTHHDQLPFIRNTILECIRDAKTTLLQQTTRDLIDKNIWLSDEDKQDLKNILQN